MEFNSQEKTRANALGLLLNGLFLQTKYRALIFMGMPIISTKGHPMPPIRRDDIAVNLGKGGASNIQYGTTVQAMT